MSEEEKAALGGGREGRRAKAGEIGKWDGAVPAEHRPRSKGAACLSGQAGRADRVGHPLQDVFEGSCKQLLTIQGATRYWEPGREGEVPLTPSGCVSYKGMPGLAWAESLSDSRKVWVNGRGPPRSTPATFQERRKAY